MLQRIRNHTKQQDLFGSTDKPLTHLLDQENQDGFSIDLTFSTWDGTYEEFPYSVFQPDHYVESYAYPTLVALHDENGSEFELSQWFPAISDRNYIGLGVRGPFPSSTGFPGQFNWKLRRPDASMGIIRDTIMQAKDFWNIHPDRIYLVGEGTGAIVALQVLFLQQAALIDELPPVAGVVCNNLPGYWDRLLPPYFGESEGRVLFLDQVETATGTAVLDQLQEVGLEVTVRPTTDEDPARFVDRWIMSGIATSVS